MSTHEHLTLEELAALKGTTTDDLLGAIDWLTTYDGGEDDHNGEAFARVAGFLAREVATRQFDAQVDAVVRTLRAQYPDAREATLRSHARTALRAQAAEAAQA